jgi:hypothetical protein
MLGLKTTKRLLGIFYFDLRSWDFPELRKRAKRRSRCVACAATAGRGKDSEYAGSGGEYQAEHGRMKGWLDFQKMRNERRIVFPPLDRGGKT